MGEERCRSQIENMSDEELCVFFEMAKQAEDYLEALQRSRADLENYRKRMERERGNMRKFAAQDLLVQMLGVMRLLELAIASKNVAVDDGFREGVELVHSEFQKVLEDAGVRPIEALKCQFNPNYHEAMQQRDDADHPDMTIIEELEKGYMLYDRVLIASKVVVSRLPVELPESEEGD